MNSFTDTSDSLTVGRCKISNDISLPAHYHKQVEFVYVMSGTLVMSVTDKVYTLTKGQFAIIKSLDIHSFLSQSGGEVLLMILPDMYSIKLTDVRVSTKVFTAANPDIDIVSHMYKQFIGMSERYMHIYYQLFYETIRSLFSTKEALPKTGNNNIISYINEHYKENLSLDSVAAVCSTNRTYVSKAVNDCFGIGFIRYVNKLRISSFLDIYLEKNQSDTIENIIAQVGFNDIRTFYRAFSRELGCTPADFLKKNAAASSFLIHLQS